MPPACHFPARNPFARFALMPFAAEGHLPAPLTSAEGQEKDQCSGEGWGPLHGVI